MLKIKKDTQVFLFVQLWGAEYSTEPESSNRTFVKIAFCINVYLATDGRFEMSPAVDTLLLLEPIFWIFDLGINLL